MPRGVLVAPRAGGDPPTGPNHVNHREQEPDITKAGPSRTLPEGVPAHPYEETNNRRYISKNPTATTDDESESSDQSESSETSEAKSGDETDPTAQMEINTKETEHSTTNHSNETVNSVKTLPRTKHTQIYDEPIILMTPTNKATHNFENNSKAPGGNSGPCRVESTPASKNNIAVQRNPLTELSNKHGVESTPAPRNNIAVQRNPLTELSNMYVYLFDVPSIYDKDTMAKFVMESTWVGAYFRPDRKIRDNGVTADWTCELDAHTFRQMHGNIRLAGKLYRIRIKDQDKIPASYHMDRSCARCGSFSHLVKNCPKPRKPRGPRGARTGRPAICHNRAGPSVSSTTAMPEELQSTEDQMSWADYEELVEHIATPDVSSILE